MKKTSVLILSILLFSSGWAQSSAGFEITKDPLSQEETMLVGTIHKADITGDSAFAKWYEESLKIYPRANKKAVEALKDNKDKIYLIIFGGTWCPDTHYVLPKFFKIQEEAGFPENRMAIFAVDHSKKMLNPIAEALNVKSVPTIIVMKDGKELGRVVEYGKTGYWDKELAEIINEQ